ncbi:SSI family serine proteinase inhibitor [Nocardiopsis lambiniae]|uniref:SSI family serine proteinase inhibitor n=1 Tax=Nocardiopsis lambiniae TaxID=3075539 RepID=A0ABU2M3H8_9ACTN|nr:SSI family serine proteinase inhibitor [Nocardiopsis sp. DSM 44743]MDT0327196.1 SSI family serine proteinase inhibitor [Nocardiopsis sp. DSM 44743]
MKRLAVLGLALVAALAPATASAERHSVRYVLTITDGYTGDYIGDRSVVTLNCDPAGGTHPEAEAACAAIAEAGSIKEITPTEGFCTMEYRPVTVTAGGAENFERTYGNRCELSLAKGVVFAF